MRVGAIAGQSQHVGAANDDDNNKYIVYVLCLRACASKYILCIYLSARMTALPFASLPFVPSHIRLNDSYIEYVPRYIDCA